MAESSNSAFLRTSASFTAARTMRIVFLRTVSFERMASFSACSRLTLSAIKIIIPLLSHGILHARSPKHMHMHVHHNLVRCLARVQDQAVTTVCNAFLPG